MVDQVSAEAPHVDAPAADFVDGDGPVYTLAGQIVATTGEEGATSHWLLVGQGLVRPIEEEFLPLFEFFQTPRTEQQAQEWLEWAGGPEYLQEMVQLKLVVAVDARRAWAAAKCLRGLRLVPRAAPGQAEGSEIGVVPEGSQKPVTYVGPELAAVLWDEALGDDVPTVVKRIARDGGFDRERAARLVLSEVPMLIGYGLARLEWVRVPSS